MDVALKIWRYDPESGERELEAPKLDWKPVTMTKWKPQERTY